MFLGEMYTSLVFLSLKFVYTSQRNSCNLPRKLERFLVYLSCTKSPLYQGSWCIFLAPSHPGIKVPGVSYLHQVTLVSRFLVYLSCTKSPLYQGSWCIFLAPSHPGIKVPSVFFLHQVTLVSRFLVYLTCTPPPL